MKKVNTLATKVPKTSMSSQHYWNVVDQRVHIRRYDHSVVVSVATARHGHHMLSPF